MLMSPEVALLDEMWDALKPHIQKKDRLEIAEMIVRMFDEHLNIEDIEVYKNEFDSVMKAAIVSHFDYLEDAEEDEDEYDYDDRD
jgi:hypothetical protein